MSNTPLLDRAFRTSEPTMPYYYDLLETRGIFGHQAGQRLRGAMVKLRAAGYGTSTEPFSLRRCLHEMRLAYDVSENKDVFLLRTFGAENATVGRIFIETTKPHRIKYPITAFSLNSIQSVRSAQVTAMLSKHRGEKALHDLFPEPGQLDEFTNRPFTKVELRRYYMSKGRYSGNNKTFIP